MNGQSPSIKFSAGLLSLQSTSHNLPPRLNSRSISACGGLSFPPWFGWTFSRTLRRTPLTPHLSNRTAVVNSRQSPFTSTVDTAAARTRNFKGSSPFASSRASSFKGVSSPVRFKARISPSRSTSEASNWQRSKDKGSNSSASGTLQVTTVKTRQGAGKHGLG